MSLGEGVDNLGAQSDQEASLVRFLLCSCPHASDMSESSVVVSCCKICLTDTHVFSTFLFSLPCPETSNGEGGLSALGFP